MRRMMVVSAVVAGLLFLAAAGWAESQSSPGQPQERQGMGPGMMGRMPMGGDMAQMMQACIQMMNQMAGMMPGMPMQPSQPQTPPK